VPDEARQVFDYLSRKSLIPEEHAEIYKKMVQFRHLVVHFYVDVQLDRVYNILQENLDDFDLFIGDVKNILEESTTE
jgi:uncharacterized protein YutE (UPF0331/DUF86 family)